MRKFIFSMIAMLTFAIGASAQVTSNYAGSSKAFSNIDVLVRVGGVNSFNHILKDGNVTPFFGVEADKYVTPWLALGVDARASVGTGDAYNPHTMIDMVNVGGVLKFNINNFINFTGDRHRFEVTPYVGLGWAHYNCSNITSLQDIYNHESAMINVNGTNAYVGLPSQDYEVLRNAMTFRPGCSFVLNLGKAKKYAVGLDISDVWGGLDNGRLVKNHGYVEASLMFVAHLGGTYGKAKLYDQAEVDALNARINELQNRPVQVVEKTVEKTDYKTITINPDSHFAYNESIVDPTSESVLDDLATEMKNGGKYTVTGYASVEGDEDYNLALSQKRADAVKEVLVNRGVKAENITAVGAGETTKFGDSYEANRRVIVTKD